MKWGWLKYVAVIGLFALQSLLFFMLPLSLPSIYLSPDETAVAVSAREFGARGSLRLADQILEAAQRVHPRSFVTQGQALVPVGFLGLPILFGILWRLFSEFGLLLFTPLLAISVAYPLWRMAQRLGRLNQIATVATWLSFPTVILYANRGLFPNLVVVSLAVWSAYLVWERHSALRTIFAGLFFGIAVAVRPTELPWLAVWLLMAWTWDRKRVEIRRSWKRAIAFVAAASLWPLLACFMAWKTYGSPLAVGYFLRDSSGIGQAARASVASTVVSWPFGFHPLVMLLNISSYVAGIIGPWVAVSLLAITI